MSNKILGGSKLNNLNIIEPACPFIADYSSIVTGNRILPFVFKLDSAASNLNPSPGEKQRFCYNITASGQDTRTFADLSHFVFVICPDIPEGELTSVTVSINGVSEQVRIGNNVKIFTPPKADPPTACPGLKFDFGLDKVNGEMAICFELEKTYPIGPTEICLFGAGETKKGLFICGPICNGNGNGNGNNNGDPGDGSCPRDVYVPATVCADINITPYVQHRCEPTLHCCGEPRLSSTPTSCPGVKNQTIHFTVSQDICIKIPLEFGATTLVGEPFVQAGNPTLEDICSGCESSQEE